MMLDDHLRGTDALVALDDAYAAAWAIRDRSLLELCARRMAMLRRHEPTLAAMTPAEQRALASWPTDVHLDDVGRAALAFTEQWIVDVASLSDEQADALCSVLGDQRFADFVTALLIVEQRMSLELFLDRVL
ncbi:MAG: hypothetical protein R2710_05655 [Acidimicrobiales bacterium]